jgi:hypothetical protein
MTVNARANAVTTAILASSTLPRLFADIKVYMMVLYRYSCVMSKMLRRAPKTTTMPSGLATWVARNPGSCRSCGVACQPAR